MKTEGSWPEWKQCACDRQPLGAGHTHSIYKGLLCDYRAQPSSITEFSLAKLPKACGSKEPSWLSGAGIRPCF